MQKELMESGQQLQRSQTLVSREGLEKMAKELLRLCDQVERHGLVDYQYGVWEEQIIAGALSVSQNYLCCLLRKKKADSLLHF